jgi:transposase InsO family protein
MGIRDRPTSFRSPWQNGHVERLVGSTRRECTDHMIVFNEEHLRRILSEYARYYNEVRTHLALGKDAPFTRPVEQGTSSRSRSWVGCTIDTRGSNFRKRQLSQRPWWAAAPTKL